MSNVKIQMTKTTMNTQVLTFSHLDFIWHLSFDIWAYLTIDHSGFYYPGRNIMGPQKTHYQSPTFNSCLSSSLFSPFVIPAPTLSFPLPPCHSSRSMRGESIFCRIIKFGDTIYLLFLFFIFLPRFFGETMLPILLQFFP